MKGIQEALECYIEQFREEIRLSEHAAEQQLRWNNLTEDEQDTVAMLRDHTTEQEAIDEAQRALDIVRRYEVAMRTELQAVTERHESVTREALRAAGLSEFADAWESGNYSSLTLFAGVW